VIKKLMINRNIQLINDKICVLDVFEIVKQTQYYRNIQRIAKSRYRGSKKTGS
jgi:hypothetical protein